MFELTFKVQHGRFNEGETHTVTSKNLADDLVRRRIAVLVREVPEPVFELEPPPPLLVERLAREAAENAPRPPKGSRPNHAPASNPKG